MQHHSRMKNQQTTSKSEKVVVYKDSNPEVEGEEGATTTDVNIIDNYQESDEAESETLYENARKKTITTVE